MSVFKFFSNILFPLLKVNDAINKKDMKFGLKVKIGAMYFQEK